MDALHLLSGDPATFISEVWGRRILVHTTDADALDALFGIDAADALITTGALRTPQVRLAQDGKVLDQSRYTRRATIAGQPMTGLVDARKVLALFDGGATIVFQGLQRYHEPLRQLIRSLEQELGHPCQANAYLTPPGSQGFALHSDTHDVFTFQTFGEKEWEVHDDEGAHRVSMRPGTSLYLPTGTPHMARTGSGAASLHVTVGINRHVWSDVLREVVARAIEADDSLHEPLPAALFEDPERLTALLAERLRHVADLVAGVDAASEGVRLEERFGTGRQPVLAGGLRDVLDLRRLDADGLVERRPGAQAVLRSGRQDADQVALLLGDRRLTLPARVESPLRWVLSQTSPFAASGVPGMDADSALVLIRRLVREGLLRVVR